MNSIILNGASASGNYVGKPMLSLIVESIDFSLPASGTLTNASVTLSGAYGGDSYTFNNDVDLTLRFKPNEDVNITTTNFLTGYTAVINYVEAGDQSSYMMDGSRTGYFNTPWRYR